MAEFEQALIVTKSLRTDSDTLERDLQLAPERFRATPIVDIKSLKESIAEGTTIKLAVIHTNTPHWQRVIKNLSESGVKVYALSILSSIEICAEAYRNGASGYGHSLSEIFGEIASTAAKE